jgi:hypothetical protein
LQSFKWDKLARFPRNKGFNPSNMPRKTHYHHSFLVRWTSVSLGLSYYINARTHSPPPSLLLYFFSKRRSYAYNMLATPQKVPSNPNANAPKTVSTTKDKWTFSVLDPSLVFTSNTSTVEVNAD